MKKKIKHAHRPVYTVERVRVCHGGKVHWWSLAKRPGSDNYWVHSQRDGKKIVRSLKTASRDLAVARLKLIVEKSDFDAIKKLHNTSDHLDYATIGEIWSCYNERPTPRPVTKEHYKAGLMTFLHRVYPNTKNHLELTVEVFTDAAVRRLEDYYYNHAGQNGLLTASDVMSKVRPIFRARCLRWYEQHDLNLPREQLKTFIMEPCGESRQVERFIPISPVAMQMMEKAILDEAPAVQLIYYLMTRAGLRPVECYHARWNWIGENQITVGDNHYLPKNGMIQSVPLAHETMELLNLFRPETSEGWHYLLPGKDSERESACSTGINAFVRKYIVGRQKGAYNLRKQAGSAVLTKTGSIHAAAVFLRDSVIVAERYYASFLNPPPGITTEDVAYL